MVDRKGNSSSAKLSVRIKQDSFAVVGDALEQTQAFAQRLSQPLVSNHDVSDQQKLVISFNAFKKKFKSLVKIAEEVAKVRSSPSLDSLN